MKQQITKLLLLFVSVAFFNLGANAQLSGTYTVGSGTGYDYGSVAAAASALASSGVNGAVTFEIADGTYSGQVSFGSISGLSSTNTVTFISDSEDSSKVTITHNSTYTVYATGADYINFEHVTIENTSSSTHYTVYLSSGSNYWSFNNSRIIASRTGTFSYTIYWRGNEFLDVLNTRIIGGYYQMYNWGNGTGSSASEGLHVENSTFVGAGYYAFYNRNLRESIIKDNYIDSMQRSGIGVYSYYCNMEWIEGNEIIGANYGFYWFYGNTVGPSSDSTVVINNISINNAIYGFYARDLDNVRMYHNVFTAPSSRYSFYWYNLRRDDIYFANNILVGGGFYGFYAYFGGTSYMPELWDYNDYYLNNTTYFCYFNGYLATSLSNLQSRNSNYNQNCVYVDPDFMSSTNGRTYTPALNNIGLNVGINRDVDGNVRPNTGDQGKVDIGANDFYLSPKDLDVFALVSPLSVSLGTNSITAQFRNAGSDTLKNEDVYVQYSTDSGSTWITDTMSITTLDPGDVQQFTFDQTWTPTRSGYFRISIKISQSVNNDPDQNEQEDYDVCSGLSGTFTIGGTGADYASFGAALSDLDCGVAGPILYNVASGTYTENLEFGLLLGATSSNTVTFRGSDRDSVILRSANGNTITLSGTDHLAFEDMTIRMDGTSGFTVSLSGDADHNRFENCLIYNNTSRISTACNPIVISGSSTSYFSRGPSGSYNHFIDNTVQGGYFGAYITGASTSDFAVGNTWINNDFEDAYFYGFYSYFEDSLTFNDNHIDDFRNTFNYSAMFYYTSNFNIERNYLKSAYGSYLAYSNFYNYNQTNRSLFANNMLIGGRSWALYGYYMGQTNFWHNSVHGDGTRLVYWYYANNNDIQNNIFSYGGTGTALWFFRESFVNWDYNNYYLSSGNLAWMGGTTYASASALTAYNASYNQNNISVDPVWVDEDDDHHLTSNSPDMFGARVDMELDHDQDNRCVFAPSIGPDEKGRVSLPPTANFLTPDTAWLGSPTILLNSAKASKTSAAQWWVNGTYTSDSIHLEYTPTNTGMDTITLVMENCSGTDTLTKMVYVSPILRAPSIDFSATSRDIYTDDIVTLLDLSENGATQWEWSISPKVVYDPFLLIWSRTHWYLKGKDSTTANPQLYFDYPGVYEVKLKVANSFGADSLVRTSYIKVRQRSEMCDIPWDTDGKIGTLYDNGGVDGSYSSGLNGLNKCTYMISDCYGTIDFSVEMFDLGDNDYLQVYDGVDEGGKPLWNAGRFPDGMTGTRRDASVETSFTASSGSAYFVFTSDDNAQTTGKGFAIDWEMTQTTWTAPTAAITAADTVCVGFPTVFENTSTGNYSYVEWDTDNNGVTDATGDELSFTFNTAGYDTIWLHAISLCAPKDSVMKVVFVENARKAPQPDFTASGTVVSAGDTVRLEGSADYCTSGTEWTITPSSYILANDTELDDDVIDVVFTRGGFYSIELEKSNSFGKDSIYKVNHIQVLDYCTPTVANLDADVAISRVKFGDIDNTSNVGQFDYNDFLDQSTDVERGYTYELIVERSTTNKELNRKVWIDWNIDGDFDDAGELVAQEAASTNKVFTDSITIDPNAKAGATRMRVAVNYKSMSNLACGPHQFGEFEDYTINILEADKTAPELTIVGAMTDTIEVFSSWTEPGYSASDLVDGNLTADVTVNSSLDTTMVGVYTVTYSVSDNSSNTTTATRTIHVIDSTDPELMKNGDDTVYVQIYTSYTEAGTTESDNYDANLNVEVTSNLDTSVLGTYTINYCVTDQNGNGPVCDERTVIVIDTIAPMITLNGEDMETVEVFTFYTDAGYTVVENDGYTVETTGNWDGTADSLGTFTVTYTVTDFAGNMASVTRTIEVVDTKAPVIVLEGNWVDTVARWEDYVDANVSVSDNYYDNSDIVVNVEGSFENTQSEGTYTIEYSAEDPSGNVSQVLTRLVFVIQDTTTSVGNIDNNGFAVFPNPSNGVFFVTTSLDNGETAMLRVLDITGKEIYNAGNFVVNNGKFEVDMSSLATGTYYIEINSSNAKTVEQVMITK